MEGLIVILLFSVLANGVIMNAVNALSDEENRASSDDLFNSNKRIIGALGGTPGGLTDIPLNELQGLNTKMAEVFTLLNSQCGDFKYKMNRVISGKKQVVAGHRYLMEVEAYNEANELKNCKADIWEKTWENFLQAEMCCDNIKYTAIRKSN